MDIIEKAQTIVVKIGSSLLVDEEKSRIHEKWLNSLVEDLYKIFLRMNKNVVIVTSGAIALGKKNLQIKPGHIKLEQKQAAASVGQIELVHHFKDAFAKHDYIIGQILLTVGDIDERKRYINARNTIMAMFELGIIPVINENDAIATSEIKIGDNDRLAAKVAQMVGADLYILLSDIDGLYDKDPREFQDAQLVPLIEKITPKIEAMAGKAGSSYGTGGMVTKIEAAKIAVSAGCNMILTSGKGLNPLKKLGKDKPSSLFVANSTPKNARKTWIATSLKVKGTVKLNENAGLALEKGRSLLPIGVMEVTGNFAIGETVSILNYKDEEIARGIIGYSSQDTTKIIGHSTAKIETLLGYRGPDELIHRNDLVLLKDSE